MDTNTEHTAALKTSIRKTMRARRRMLSEQDRAFASRELNQQLHKSGLLAKSQHLGLYIGNDGELDPSPAIPSLSRLGISCYLPRICDLGGKTMHFAKYSTGQALSKNRFGIPEPSRKVSRVLPTFLLSTVLVPLVAFDLEGNRLGMGGGFYDRLFNRKRVKRKPRLIGIAYEFQRANHLPTESWDIPLDGVMTEKSFYRF